MSNFLVGSPAGGLAYNSAVSQIGAKFSRDASFARGYNKGVASYSDKIAANQRFAQNSRNIAAMNQRVFNQGPHGNFGDFAYRYGAQLIEGAYQGLQFAGKAVANGATLGLFNDTLSPLTSSYDSLVGEGNFFGAPTTFAGRVGDEAGAFGSYFIDPLAAVGALGKLAKYNVNLSLQGSPVHSSSMNWNNAGLVDAELGMSRTEMWGQSPWPKGVDPRSGIIPEGTIIKMIQSESDIARNRIGGWGVLGDISIADDQVRNSLALTTEFKKAGDSYGWQYYKVKQDMATNMGPVGWQVDKLTGNFYPGTNALDQLGFDVRYQDRELYLDRLD